METDDIITVTYKNYTIIGNKNNFFKYRLYGHKLYTGNGIINFFLSGDKYEGDIKTNDKHGQGKYFFADGARYEGNWKNGVKDGQGKVFYRDGKLNYDGNWKNGEKDGQGKVFYGDGNLNYEGEWQNGVKNGKGKLFYRDGSKYEGEWKNGEKYGQGKTFYNNGKPQYEGEWKNGEKYGQGKYFYKDGSKYEGNWKDDKFNGLGKHFYPNGILKYEGYCKDDKFNGQGKYFYPNGILEYEGNCKDGKFNGKGKYYYPNGNLKFEGNWKNGVEHGEGTLYEPDGAKYVGNWINGIEDGKGKYFDKNGNLLAKKDIIITFNSSIINNNNKIQNFDEQQKFIYKLFGTSENFEKWIENFTPSEPKNDIHNIYRSIENIHHVFRILQDITMNKTNVEKKSGDVKSLVEVVTDIKSDNSIPFKQSDSNFNDYTDPEKTHILNKFANNLYKYLIRKHNMNKQKNSFTKSFKQSVKKMFTRKTQINDNTQINDDKKCFGIEYAKEIQEMIRYSILHVREGLLSKSATVPMIIMSKTIPPYDTKKEPINEPVIPNKPFKPESNNNVTKTKYEEDMKKYDEDMTKYLKDMKEFELKKKNQNQYDENVATFSEQYVEVGDTCLNIIRLIDAFLETLPSTLQTDIARTYMIDFIEGYDSKICTFNPKKNFTDNFLASCGLGNLKKLILSLYKVLSQYIVGKKEEIKYIDKPIDCNSDVKFAKLFYGSNTKPKSDFKNQDKKITDSGIITELLNGWYTDYLKKQFDKSYKNFLSFIITKWYETQCDVYNQNKNFIIGLSSNK